MVQQSWHAVYTRIHYLHFEVIKVLVLALLWSFFQDILLFSPQTNTHSITFMYLDDNNIVEKNIKISLTLGLELSVSFVVSILYKYSVWIQLCKSSLRSGSNTEINDLADEMEMPLAVYTWKHGQTYVAVNQQCLLLLFFSSINTTDQPLSIECFCWMIVGVAEKIVSWFFRSRKGVLVFFRCYLLILQNLFWFLLVLCAYINVCVMCNGRKQYWRYTQH